MIASFEASELTPGTGIRKGHKEHTSFSWGDSFRLTMPERALGVYLLGLWEGGMRNQTNAGCCCRPSSRMRFGLRIRHFHILPAAKGNNAYGSRRSGQLALCEAHKTQVASRESAVGSGRDGHPSKSANETPAPFKPRGCPKCRKGASNKSSTDSNPFH
jgi:hypothetical protein